jgi:hypothetical protein
MPRRRKRKHVISRRRRIVDEPIREKESFAIRRDVVIVRTNEASLNRRRDHVPTLLRGVRPLLGGVSVLEFTLECAGQLFQSGA